MVGTSDPTNVTAEKMLTLLASDGEEWIDDLSAQTYDGDYFADLADGSAEDLSKAMKHNELTFATVARLLADKLYEIADEAEERANDGR